MACARRWPRGCRYPYPAFGCRLPRPAPASVGRSHCTRFHPLRRGRSARFCVLSVIYTSVTRQILHGFSRPSENNQARNLPNLTRNRRRKTHPTTVKPAAGRTGSHRRPSSQGLSMETRKPSNAFHQFTVILTGKWRAQMRKRGDWDPPLHWTVSPSPHLRVSTRPTRC